MTDYTELVKALRRCDMKQGCFNANCRYSVGKYFCDMDKVHKDAAAAIEALQAEIRESMQKCAECGDEQEQRVKELQAEVDALAHDNERYIQFNTDLLNTKEVSKDEMDEILEYLRNAPVVPLEPMRIEQLPKRGEWHTELFDGDKKYQCSNCLTHWDVETRYCPFCGAKMREVQDDTCKRPD